jgi:hypothetical protein
MHTREMARWLLGAVFAGTAVALSAGNASADHRLVAAVLNNPGCISPDNGATFIWGEAYGYENVFNTVQCEAISVDGTTMSTCPTSAVYHRAVIEARDANGNLTGARFAISRPQTTWTSASDQVGYTFTCSGTSVSTFVSSLGQEVP